MVFWNTSSPLLSSKQEPILFAKVSSFNRDYFHSILTVAFVSASFKELFTSPASCTGMIKVIVVRNDIVPQKYNIESLIRDTIDPR